VLDGVSPGHLVAEFFVLRASRRMGVGTAAAIQLFERFPGPWWVGEHAENHPAQAFWRAVIGRYTSGAYQEEVWCEPDGERGVAQRFESVRSPEGPASGAGR
jgi:predicted acetyltransferase